MVGQRVTLNHDAFLTEDSAWRLAWPQSGSEVELRGPGFNIPSSISHWMWTAPKGGTTLGKTVFFSPDHPEKELKLKAILCNPLHSQGEKSCVSERASGRHIRFHESP